MIRPGCRIRNLADVLPELGGARSVKPWLLALMQRAKLGANVRLEPEQRLAIAVADMMRAATLEGRLSALWCTIPNEGKRSRVVAAILRAMGMIPGAGDLLIWPHGFIELKAGKNGQTDSQRNFEAWCRERGAQYVVCRSVPEVEAALKAWGVLA